jgi:large subunit ribosomal protein L4
MSPNKSDAPLTIPVRNLKAETVGEASLPPEIFGVPFRRHLVWEAVREVRARGHRGTHKTKTRSEVSGSGRKPFKQKHTGRARQGGSRPPIHRHGGTAHGPTPRSYAVKMNVRAKKAALRCVLSEKAREKKIVLLDSFELTSHRTQALAFALAGLGVAGKALLVDGGMNANLSKAARNQPGVVARDAKALNVYDALDAGTIVLSEEALRTVTEVLS